MPCEKCKDIHEAQSKGLTNLPCTCSCHPTHICPTIYPYQPYWTNPHWNTTPNTICQTGTTTFSINANNAEPQPLVFHINDHTSCGSGCSHKQ